MLICDFHNDILVIDENRKLETVDNKQGVSNKRIGRAEAWRNSSLLVKIGSSVFYIDQEERNLLRRVDLSDGRSFTLRLPAFLTFLATQPAKKPESGKQQTQATADYLYVMSRGSEMVFKVRVDISLLVLVDSLKLNDLEDHKPSMIEVVDSQQLLVVCAEKEISADAFSNRLIAIDITLSKEVARRDLVVRGKASWFERMEVCHTSDDRIYLGLIALHQFSFYLVKIDIPVPAEDMLSEQTRLKTEDSNQNLRGYNYLEESNRAIIPEAKIKIFEAMAVFRSHKRSLSVTQSSLTIYYITPRENTS